MTSPGTATVEVAAFRPQDDDSLVGASLSCPVCLREEIDWSLVVGRYEATVRCRCLRCSHERTVFVTLDQALRLALQGDRPLDPTLRPAPLPLGA
jgi:hypothetical protein